MSSYMHSFTNMLQEIKLNGIDQLNTRTKEMCRVLVGYQLQYDVSEFFPLLTARKLFFDGIIGELLGFFRGYDNAADFRALGCNLWNANANETPAWLANPNRKGIDDLGRIYSKQWTDWKDRRIVFSPDECDGLEAKGYVTIADACSGHSNSATYFALMERSINQLEVALTKLLTDPSDRRIIITGWNPAEFDLQCLPACHMDYRYVAFENPRVLHVIMTIRSWDCYLGGPTNIASTVLQLLIMARLAGYTPGTITIQATNTHLYHSHFDAVDELLTREHLEPPKLILSDNIKQITDLNDVKGAFERIYPDDIILENYQHQAVIKAKMAV